MHKSKNGFTLIEVIISVVIISVVIMALIQMFANNTHMFASLHAKSKINSYVSLFLSNADYGLKSEKVDLDELVKEFKIERELREELKAVKAEIVYQELESIDMREYDGSESNEENNLNEEDTQVNSNAIFEIGKSIIKINDSSASLLRIRMQ